MSGIASTNDTDPIRKAGKPSLKLLVVIGTCSTFFRFISPILSAILERDNRIEITILAPDVKTFFSDMKEIPYRLEEPVDPGYQITSKFRRWRTILAYLYWSLLGVQTELVLERMGRKFFTKQVGQLGALITPQHINGLAGILRVVRLNRPLAKLTLFSLQLLEKIVPPDKTIMTQIRDLAPDIILATPTLYPQHYDVDYIKAGLKMRIPTVTMMASWDHLSSKGLLSVFPDRLLIWNDIQIDEAEKYHAFPRNRLKVTGAPSFDWLFEKRPLISREDFCIEAGLDPQKPFILWAASAPGNCKDEKPVVRQLLNALRRHPRLKNYQVLIRPHPSLPRIWEDWLEEGTNVWLSPGFPNTEKNASGLYNSIAHAAAVTGLSTSVFLETGILDRPCALIKHSEVYKDAVFNQTLHFRYLLEFGFPEAVEDEMDFSRWLADIAEGNDKGKENRRKFVESFLRPLNINRKAAYFAAEAVLEMVPS
jgi:hypothetical protein